VLVAFMTAAWAGRVLWRDGQHKTSFNDKDTSKKRG
jgi:hypothetical protein